jgi:hypothetical protein
MGLDIKLAEGEKGWKDLKYLADASNSEGVLHVYNFGQNCALARIGGKPVGFWHGEKGEMLR